MLHTVVQAIVQNRKQLLYTLLLLFAIVYIYAFIAFIAFRGTYENIEVNGDEVGINNYC